MSVLSFARLSYFIRFDIRAMQTQTAQAGQQRSFLLLRAGWRNIRGQANMELRVGAIP
jgi:hypothetical protein